MSSNEYLPEEPQQFDRDEVRLAIERLIDACRDAEEAYRDASEHISDPSLKTYFREQSVGRAQFAADLQGELHRLGKWETTRQGSVGGAVQRVWFDVKRALGGKDHAILAEIEAGEDRSKHAYEDALKHNLPPQLAGVIRSQAQSVFAAHDHAKRVRDQKAA
jgi:uncharacterized protein (TIGR02284 family)